MTKIGYSVVINECAKDFFYGDAEFNFCKTEVNFESENPVKARNQAIDYLNKSITGFSNNAFIQLFMVLTKDNGEKENFILSTGYSKKGKVNLREENLKLESEAFRKKRFNSTLPVPSW